MSTKTVMDRMKWTTTVVLAACLLGAAEHVRIWRSPLRKTLVGVAVAVALAAAGVGEAQEWRVYKSYGAGLQGCGQFAEAREGGEK
jgi:Domain of unknown function (DUF389)